MLSIIVTAGTLLLAAPKKGGSGDGPSADPSPPKAVPAGAAAPQQRDAIDLLSDPATNLLDRRTEAAIKRGLDCLKKNQRLDGQWGPDNDDNKVAYTSFAMIAFMANGHFPGKKQPYGECMSKALNSLVAESKGQNGYMGSIMYAHGLATLALSEVWGHTDRDDEVRDALKAAVKVILGAQNKGGGWRYLPTPGGHDVSVTAMQVVALASARQAGIYVPEDTITRAVRYVNSCHRSSDGGFAYMPGAGISGFARTGASCFSMMMLGKHGAPEVREGIKYIRREADENLKQSIHFTYGMYYATLCMYQSSPEDFQWWYPKIRDRLLARQMPDGRIDSVHYDTPVYLIILSIPYGYVPGYQR